MKLSRLGGVFPWVNRFCRCLSALCLALTVSLVSCSDGTLPVPVTSAVSQWVVGWGVSPQNAVASAEDPGGSEQSFRFLVLPTVPGTKERIHLSNYYGSTPVTIGAARIAAAIGTGSAVDTTTDTAITFGGSKTVTLAPKQEIDSDPVSISYSYGTWLAVSVYVSGTFPPLTEHDSQVSPNYATVVGAGDRTTDNTGAAFGVTNTEWLLLTGVEVYGPYQGTVAFFGSSSVDGHASNFGNMNAYPVANVPVAGQNNDRPTDWLARSLLAAGYQIGVLNAGLLGDPAGEGTTSSRGTAPAGVDRFDHDVLQQPAIKAVVIYTGGIDLRADCVPATSVETSLSTLVSEAYAKSVRVVLATIPPSEYCIDSGPEPSAANPFNGDVNPGPENAGSTQRRAVNDWIRTTGAQLPGVVGIADFDQVLRYPAHPDFMVPNLNSGDNFHPNGVGYGVQNSAIPLRVLLGQ